MIDVDITKSDCAAGRIDQWAELGLQISLGFLIGVFAQCAVQQFQTFNLAAQFGDLLLDVGHGWTSARENGCCASRISAGCILQ